MSIMTRFDLGETLSASLELERVRDSSTQERKEERSGMKGRSQERKEERKDDIYIYIESGRPGAEGALARDTSGVDLLFRE
jgi:hypothetical protein